MAITLLIRAFGGSPEPSPAVSPGLAEDADPRAGSEAQDPTVTTVEIGHGGGIDVAVGEGSVWVTTSDAVLRLDPATNEVIAEIPVEYAFKLSVAPGSVWVTRGGGPPEVVRVDPRTNEVVARINVGGNAYCAEVGHGSVWVGVSTSNGGDILRLHGQTHEVVATIHVPPGSGAGGIGCLVVSEDAVWAIRGGRHDSLLRIDPTTNRIAAVIDVPNPDYWNEAVVEGGALWLAMNPSNSVQVVRIDPETNQVGEPIEVGGGMFGVGSGNGSVWVYDGFSDALTRIDAVTGEIVDVVEIPDGGSSWGGDPGIAAADGVVWMAGTYTLNRIDLL